MIGFLIRRHVPEVGRQGRLFDAPADARPAGPQDLSRVALGLSGVTTTEQMRAALQVLQPLVGACEDDDFDRFMARSVSGQQLEEAMTIGAVVTEFQRSLDEIRQRGSRGGSSRDRWRCWCSCAEATHHNQQRRREHDPEGRHGQEAGLMRDPRTRRHSPLVDGLTPATHRSPCYADTERDPARATPCHRRALDSCSRTVLA